MDQVLKNPEEEEPTIQLLYIWIGEDQTGFIKETGFNLSVEHHFELKVENEKYILTYEKKETKDLWKRDNIVGLSAVVGKNGAGKTLLLRSIWSNTLVPKRQEDRDDYQEFINESNWKERCLLVYSFSDDGGERIHVYHNLDGLEANPEFKPTNINEIKDNMPLLDDVINSLQQQTRVYVTNSYYVDDPGYVLSYGG